MKDLKKEYQNRKNILINLVSNKKSYNKLQDSFRRCVEATNLKQQAKALGVKSDLDVDLGANYIRVVVKTK